MVWAKSEFTKKAVMRAGEVLISKEFVMDEWSRAWDILSNWRAAHAYPMHALLMMLRNRSVKIDKSAIVVQRLKRTPSILEKLTRYPDMKLHRMQDISGCRAIIANVRDVEKLAESITSSRTRHCLHKVNNYIDSPKESGYRGIHLVYKYGGEKEEYKDYFVELQLRSKIQHAWATAVEIVDTFTQQALKASRGSQDWKDFFTYISAEFAKIEKRPVDAALQEIDTASEARRLADLLHVVERLNAFAVSVSHITQKLESKTDYFLLELTEHAKKIVVTQFKTSDFEKATKTYLEREKASKDNVSHDVVLVAASSMHALRRAYPNYFADSKDFLKYMERVIVGKKWS